MKEQLKNDFENFFKNNIDLLFILDLNGHIIKINNAVTQTLGYTEEEIIGKNVIEMHPEEFREEANEVVYQMIIGNKKSCLIPLLTKYKEYIPVDTRVFQGVWESNEVLIGVCRDLSELKLSEKKFFNVFNLSHVLMAISTFDTGIYIDVNQQFLEILGYSKEEIVGKSSKELDIFNDYSERANVLKLFSELGYVNEYEIIVKKRSGELLNCLFSIDKIKIQTHEYLLTSASNITLLKNAESKVNFLFKQQKLIADISQLLNTSNDLEKSLNTVLDLLGRHTAVSRVYIFENSFNGLNTSNTYEWCNQSISPQIDELQNIPYEIIPSWKKILTKDGSIFSENIKELPDDVYSILESQQIKSILIYPITIENSFYGFIGFDECKNNKAWTNDEKDLLKTVSNIISNAFERKTVLNELKNSELRLNLAINSAKEGFWDWNIQTGHVYYSEMWCKMLGYEQYEIPQDISTWEKLVYPDDLAAINKALNKHFLKKTDYYESIHRVKTKDGSWKWILDHGKVIEWDSKNKPYRAIGTHIDITNHKNTEQQLQELINTKDKLFSIIAHDLRGPIANFQLVLELMTNNEIEIDEKLKTNFLNELKKASKNTGNLLENLLNWSRSQTNFIKIKPKTFEINSLIRDAIDLTRYMANLKSIEIISNLPNDLKVYADIDSINLIIRNLLNNAIKFTPVNGVIHITGFLQKNQVIIEFEDNGTGINKDVLNDLFNPKTFYSTYGTNNEKGSGIGLILCKDFAIRNNGDILAESVFGKGSKFSLILPKGKKQ